MIEIVKLKSRKDDFGHVFSEHEAPNRLVMIKPYQSPFVDLLACAYNGHLFKDIFPYSIDTKLPYRVCDHNFVDPAGGPLIEKTGILTKDHFFKTKVSVPTDTQKYGCEKCVEDEKEEQSEEYVEPDLLVLDIINTETGIVIMLKENKDEN